MPKSTATRTHGSNRYFLLTLLMGLLAGLPVLWAQEYPTGHQVFMDGTAVLVQDYANMPVSSIRREKDPYPPPIDYSGQLGRPTSLRSEPTGAPLAASRFFVVDQNGTLYILDKASKKFTPYLELGKIYPKFISDPPFGVGFVSLEFDPGYAKNGKFYTVHTERTTMGGSNAPVAAVAGLDLKGFTTTDAINSPEGKVGFDCVVTEWTDTNIKNSTFEGTAREVLRAGLNFSIHPMGEIAFNPLARPGSADYGNLYIGVGDGASGERAGPTHGIPQRLDALPGKILRITPDINLRPKDMLSSNGRYRIPSTGADPNPFVAVSSARPEIYAYGFRNPHRLSWDPGTGTLIADDVGLHEWEEANIIVKGGNYGWAEREGPEQVFVGGPNGGKTDSTVDPPQPFPSDDTLVVNGLPEPVKPMYPAAVFTHEDGAAIGPGFVYNGKLLPQLKGKYIFTDIPTARLFYADFKEMAASKGIRGKSAAVHEIQVMYKSPNDASTAGPVKWRLYDIITEAFVRKSGVAPANTVMPGVFAFTGPADKPNAPGPELVDTNGVKYGGGRADARLALGGDGELYLLCKTDGWIRKIVAVTASAKEEKTTARQ